MCFIDCKTTCSFVPLHWYNIVSYKHEQHDASQGSLEQADLDPRVTLHYGIPSTASILAFDPIQGLLAIGTL